MKVFAVLVFVTFLTLGLIFFEAAKDDVAEIKKQANETNATLCLGVVATSLLFLGALIRLDDIEAKLLKGLKTK